MFTSGFFNSVNSDRRYNAEQMSAIFDGLITDGIFDTIGDHFQVTPGDGLTVSVGTGRAWLNSTWSYNDTAYPISLSAASPTLARKDLICIKVDKSTAVRANSIVLIEGTPASTPVEPTVTDDTTNEIYYHKLAAVTVQAGATAISAADIYNYIGLSTGTPYVTGIVSTTAVDELWSQWDGEFHDWWENTIKPVINTETVTRLQNNIDHITPKEATMNLYGFSHLNPPPSGKTYQEYSTDAILNQISSLLNTHQSSITELNNIETSIEFIYGVHGHLSEVGTYSSYIQSIWVSTYENESVIKNETIRIQYGDEISLDNGYPAQIKNPEFIDIEVSSFYNNVTRDTPYDITNLISSAARNAMNGKYINALYIDGDGNMKSVTWNGIAYAEENSMNNIKFYYTARKHGSNVSIHSELGCVYADNSTIHGRFYRKVLFGRAPKFEHSIVHMQNVDVTLIETDVYNANPIDFILEHHPLFAIILSLDDISHRDDGYAYFGEVVSAYSKEDNDMTQLISGYGANYNGGGQSYSGKVSYEPNTKILHCYPSVYPRYSYNGNTSTTYAGQRYRLTYFY